MYNIHTCPSSSPSWVSQHRVQPVDAGGSSLDKVGVAPHADAAQPRGRETAVRCELLRTRQRQTRKTAVWPGLRLKRHQHPRRASPRRGHRAVRHHRLPWEKERSPPTGRVHRRRERQQRVDASEIRRCCSFAGSAFPYSVDPSLLLVLSATAARAGVVCTLAQGLRAVRGWVCARKQLPPSGTTKMQIFREPEFFLKIGKILPLGILERNRLPWSILKSYGWLSR